MAKKDYNSINFKNKDIDKIISKRKPVKKIKSHLLPQGVKKTAWTTVGLNTYPKNMDHLKK
tara:strand:- start:826 stop:1008 length:183 start_codon:yes stop_codon:yes gene_type:complete